MLTTAHTIYTDIQNQVIKEIIIQTTTKKA